MKVTHSTWHCTRFSSAHRHGSYFNFILFFVSILAQPEYCAYVRVLWSCGHSVIKQTSKEQSAFLPVFLLCFLHYSVMSANNLLLFVIVGQNEPLYEAELLKKDSSAASDSATRQNYFVLHSSLDLVEKAAWTTNNMYLKVVDKVSMTEFVNGNV